MQTIERNNFVFGFFLLPFIPAVVYFLDYFVLEKYVINILNYDLYLFPLIAGQFYGESNVIEYHVFALYMTIVVFPFLVLYWHFFGARGVLLGRISGLLIIKSIAILIFFVILYISMWYIYNDIDLTSSRRVRNISHIKNNLILFHIFALWPIHFFALIFSAIIKTFFLYLKGE